MKRKEFRKLVSVEEAGKIIDNLQVNPRTDIKALENALGQILAKDIISGLSVPPFRRAVMDGYAVKASDTYTCSESEPIRLRLLGNIPAGSDAGYEIQAGQAVEIATGAPIPRGADAVVMVEYSSEEDGEVLISRPVATGENIMNAGADLQKGERVLREGRKLGAREIGVLASIGLKEVPVMRLPVGIISTGDELVRPGEKLAAGQVYDANSYTLYAGVQECGGLPRLYGIAKDNESSIRRALNTAVSECSLVLTSGSTSSGSGDLIYRLIDEMGKTLAHGISIKPGKPTIIGIIGEVPLIGLPGNPTSALMIFNEFVSPLIRKALGAKSWLKKTECGNMGTSFRSEGRRQFLPVGLARGRVYPVDRGSGAITSLADADGFIEIPQETEFLEAGVPVEVVLLGDVERPDLLIAGEPCPALDLLETLSGLRFRVQGTGSSGGLSALASGTADIAAVDMPSFDMEYNLKVLRSMGLFGKAVLVKGYLREIGLIVPMDSPIKELPDLAQKRLINRNRGSGARALLELKLAELARERGSSKEAVLGSIPGYDSGAKSELAVCEAVLSKKADAGVGTRACAERNSLKFIKITEEEYDFLVQKELLEIPEIKKFLRALKSGEFASRLPAGMRVYGRTGEIIKAER